MIKVIGVRFRQAGKIYFFSPTNDKVNVGDHVIVETARGVEYGRVVIAPKEVEESQVYQPLKPVIRVATPEDDSRAQENKVKEKEALSHAAQRCLAEETGIQDSVYLEQLYTWGDDCKRDPRGRVISISYMALIPREKIKEKIGKRVTEVSFLEVGQMLSEEKEIAFDHKEILKYARERIRNKTEYTTIAFHFLPEEFTLPRLQKIYEILLGKELFKANFRKSIQEYVVDTGKIQKDGAHRPSKIYRRNEDRFSE